MLKKLLSLTLALVICLSASLAGAEEPQGLPPPDAGDSLPVETEGQADAATINEEALAIAAEKVREIINEAGEKAGKMLKAAENAVNVFNAAEKVKGIINKAAEKAGEAAEAIETKKEDLTSAAKKVTAIIGNWGRGLIADAKSAGEAVAESAGELLEAFSEKAKEAIASLRGPWEEFKDAAAEAWEKLGGVMEKVWNEASVLLEIVKERVAKLVEWVKEIISGGDKPVDPVNPDGDIREVSEVTVLGKYSLGMTLSEALAQGAEYADGALAEQAAQMENCQALVYKDDASVLYLWFEGTGENAALKEMCHFQITDQDSYTFENGRLTAKTTDEATEKLYADLAKSYGETYVTAYNAENPEGYADSMTFSPQEAKGIDQAQMYMVTKGNQFYFYQPLHLHRGMRRERDAV